MHTAVEVQDHYMNKMPHLVKVLKGRGYPHWDAEDSVQDGYINLLKWQGSCKSKDDFIHRVAFNAASQHRRRMMREMNMSSSNTELEELLDPIQDSERDAYFAQAVDILHKAMAGYEDVRQRILEEYFIDGRKLKAVCEDAGVNIATGNSWVARFRSKLKEEYGDSLKWKS